MRKLVRYEYRDAPGDALLVEVEVEGPAGQTLVGKTSAGLASQAADKFESVLSQVRPLTKSILNVVRELSQPEEVTVEFGIKLTGTAGIVLASAGTEANFKFSIRWKKDDIKPS